MVDIHNQETRSRNMRAVKSRDTALEMIIRRGLHRAGFRYRLNDTSLPGTPDLVFPRFSAVVFLHGCFWHQHGCARSKLPDVRRSFWEKKLDANANRDKHAKEQLLQAGWRIGVVWECAVRGPEHLDSERITEIIADWLASECQTLDLAGPRATRRSPRAS